MSQTLDPASVEPVSVPADDIFRPHAMTHTPAWLSTLQDQAKQTMARNGVMTGKEEHWRFTQLQPILRTQFKPAEAEYASDLFDQYTFGSDAGVEIVFVNGVYSPDLSRLDDTIDGLTVTRISKAGASTVHGARVQQTLGTLIDLNLHSFAADNTAHFSDGIYIHIRASAVIEQPVHVLNITIGHDQPTVAHTRLLVIADDNSQCTLVESYVGSGARSLCNAVTEIVCGQHVHIDHCKLQQESKASFHIGNMQVKIGQGTEFVSHAVTIGARISRNDLGVQLAGRGAYATLNGLVLIGDVQHADNHTILHHAAPDCPSHELYKHVLSDKSSAVFKGQILVDRIAQKTNAKQSSKSLLMSDTANMNSMPALEIYADDVKCTHGSTIGPIDEDLVFYLRSRGIDADAARHLLTYAFAADVTRRIKVAPVRRRIEDIMAGEHGLPQDLRINDLGAFDDAVIR